MGRVRGISLAFVGAILAEPALAAELDGRNLGVAWALPFVGILLSIALFPLLAAHFWEHHQGKIAAFWAALVILPLAAFYGVETAASLGTISARPRASWRRPSRRSLRSASSCCPR